MNYLLVSVGQGSGHSLVGFSKAHKAVISVSQDYAPLWSLGSSSKLAMVVSRIQFLVVV